MPIDFICNIIVLTTVILNDIIPRIIMLSFVMLNDVLINFVMCRVFKFYVEMLSIVTLFGNILSVIMLIAVILIVVAPSICYHHLSFIVKGEASKGCRDGIHQTYL